LHARRLLVQLGLAFTVLSNKLGTLQPASAIELQQKQAVTNLINIHRWLLAGRLHARKQLETTGNSSQRSALFYKATIAATVTTTILATVDAADEAEGVFVTVTEGEPAAVGAATSTVMG
jgi:hypothetical protein